MPFSTKAIFGKRHSTRLSSGDYAEWAVEMLTQGYDSYHLSILAGFDNSISIFETEERFHRAVKELGFDVPDTETAVRAYACEIAQQVVEGQLTGREGVCALYQLFRDTNYDPDFTIWYCLDEAFDYLRAGSFPYTYETATLENYDEVVRQEASDFIAAMRARYAI